MIFQFPGYFSLLIFKLFSPRLLDTGRKVRQDFNSSLITSVGHLAARCERVSVKYRGEKWNSSRVKVEGIFLGIMTSICWLVLAGWYSRAPPHSVINYARRRSSFVDLNPRYRLDWSYNSYRFTDASFSSLAPCPLCLAIRVPACSHVHVTRAYLCQVNRRTRLIKSFRLHVSFDEHISALMSRLEFILSEGIIKISTGDNKSPNLRPSIIRVTSTRIYHNGKLRRVR